ncbi:hypothetical protein Dsin_024727 [Dipteronia sinensis]|uniref:HAT C-terminal dimerisation domain-containing protein n=1 Tax=Dipteronia sinensis TaxID=43782 RepID=A0AAD9ZUI0_9ROSI|nr:hypothetical protein Dsin_024727 [Dipteronia sinensis]
MPRRNRPVWVPLQLCLGCIGYLYVFGHAFLYMSSQMTGSTLSSGIVLRTKLTFGSGADRTVWKCHFYYVKTLPYIDVNLLDLVRDVGVAPEPEGPAPVNKEKYPILAMIAKDILAIPISTVAFEFGFSAGSKFLSPHRRRLHSDTIVKTGHFEINSTSNSHFETNSPTGGLGQVQVWALKLPTLLLAAGLVFNIVTSVEIAEAKAILEGCQRVVNRSGVQSLVFVPRDCNRCLAGALYIPCSTVMLDNFPNWLSLTQG